MRIVKFAPHSAPSTNRRIAILVDGNNLYHYLRELKLTGLAEFDYKAFAQFLPMGAPSYLQRTTSARCVHML